nr:hypothetical protein [Xanthomonas citri]
MKEHARLAARQAQKAQSPRDISRHRGEGHEMFAQQPNKVDGLYRSPAQSSGAQ